MSKSYRNTSAKRNSRDFHEDEEENYYSRQSNYLKRREKRTLNNAIRSKNITRLLELGEDNDDDNIRG